MFKFKEVLIFRIFLALVITVLGILTVKFARFGALSFSEFTTTDNFIVTNVDTKYDKEENRWNTSVSGFISLTLEKKEVTYDYLSQFREYIEVPDVGDTIKIWYSDEIKDFDIIPVEENELPNERILKYSLPKVLICIAMCVLAFICLRHNKLI